MSVKAYVDLMSQPSRAIYLFLKLTKIPHQIVSVALRKGEHLTEDYKKNINPFSLVPVLHDSDGFKLTESIAIVQYLSSKYKNSETDKLYPTDLQQRARIDSYNNWQHLNLRFAGGGIFQHLLVKPLASGGDVDEKAVKIALGSLKHSINKLENIFLKDTKFIYCDHMTAADLFGVCELMQPYMGIGIDVFSEHERLRRWYEDVRGSIGEELFEESHKFIKFAGSTYKKMNRVVPKL